MQLAAHESEARHMQHTLTGAEYVRQITGQEADRRTRAAFRDLVLDLVPRGSRLFDFGAGPGIDARYFADHGYVVDAYDVDPRMREYFGEHCRELIEAGRVRLGRGSYREFLSGEAAAQPPADLVISDFAPLNLVDDLRELFARFNSLTGPRGKVLASVLNPLYIGEMHSRWWWRRAPRLWRSGEVFLPGPLAPHYRRRLRHFAAACAPHFRLSQGFTELSALPGHSNGIDLTRSSPLAWLHLTRYRFMFLLFEKAP